ncbi:MAG: phosphatase PAP2 family protein [Alicyclobacillus sp.]|nr:phosphatase PAP2 family protein [Alicyclobacillus sp.]
MVLHFPDGLDTPISRWCIRHWGRSATLDATMICIAEWTPVVMMGLIVIASTGAWLDAATGSAIGLWHGASAVIAALLGRVVNEPISRAVRRPRPFEQLALLPLAGHERGESFPSNHTTGAFALAVSMLGVPGYGGVMLVLAMLLGCARVYAGLHYVTDIIAGVLHGTSIAILVQVVLTWSDKLVG